eukprot:3905449-Prymnesium_polylepis.1
MPRVGPTSPRARATVPLTSTNAMGCDAASDLRAGRGRPCCCGRPLAALPRCAAAQKSECPHAS